MKITHVETLALEPIKLIQFMRFRDHRGYFTEHFRKSDLWTHDQTSCLKGVAFVQGNESFSKKGTIRGLHFQWNPFMGKMVRTLSGHMLDIVLDIRKDAPTFGKALLHDMPADPNAPTQEWIWVPPGFAHGNAFLEDTVIEYLCSGEYSPGCEAGISPFASDIDWSLCDPGLKRIFDAVASQAPIITDKDKDGPSVAAWRGDPRSDEFRDAALG